MVGRGGCQSRASSATRAASTARISPPFNRPANSPSRDSGSTTVNCSTNTLVFVPLISISGRKEASRLPVDVGATNQVDSGRRQIALQLRTVRRLVCAREGSWVPLCGRGHHARITSISCARSREALTSSGSFRSDSVSARRCARRCVRSASRIALRAASAARHLRCRP